MRYVLPIILFVASSAFAQGQGGGKPTETLPPTPSFGTGVPSPSKTPTPTITPTATATPIVVNAITVQPTNQVLFEGSDINMTATAIYSDGSQLPLVTTSATWTSSDPQIATVSETGKVKAVNPGKVTITVVGKNRTGTAVITVRPAETAPAKK